MAFYPPPRIHEATFTGGMNSDLADELMPRDTARVFLNCRVLTAGAGQLGVVQNLMGNILITTPLQAGNNKTIGTKEDSRNNKFYFLVWNSNGYHTWFMYDELLNQITPFLTNLNDTDGIDIMGLNPLYPALHIDIVIGTNQVTGQENTLLYWCDGLNKGRKVNIQKCLDKSLTGYGYSIAQEYINQYKLAPAYAPVVANSITAAGVTGYWTDLTRNSNYLYAQLFKFCYWYIYDDGEISNPSDWSQVALPPNQSYEGAGAITLDNNCLAVGINTGSPLVVKIGIAMLTTGAVTTNGVTTQGAFLPWQTIAILNKAELSLADNSQYSYNFYNDGSYIAADQDLINRPYSFMFRVPICQAFTGLAMTQTGGDEGFPAVPINVSVTNNPVQLFLPPGTVNQLNDPSFTVVQTSYATEQEFLGGTVRYDPTILVTVGADVKKGNVFILSGQNAQFSQGGDIFFQLLKGGTDHYFFSYTATAADTAVSVANYFKGALRGIGRGIPDGNNGISGEGTSGGNSYFSYTYKGQWKEAITKFTGSVTPVEYATLVDNGVSIQVKKSGSYCQYAVEYEEDDGRCSDAYTNAQCLIRTPFLTEAPGGILQQPVHTISVMHQPPIWARRWRLLRTPELSNYIQLLVQQVIDVVVIAAANPGEYLDLVVGSLFTYQQIHPDCILAYQFTRGDRVRLILDTNTGEYYTPFWETEALSYNEVTTELRNAQITVYGNQYATPSDGTLADYVGKNIQIEGIERTIIGIGEHPGGSPNDSYVLDNIINIGATIATVQVPNYTFIDRRGIIRIAKPPVGYNVENLSTIEVYTPQMTTANLDYLNFNDTGLKFDILNYGTAVRAHCGTHQNQDGTNATTLVNTPAIVVTTEGDAYIRNREMPTNNSLVDTEVIVEYVEDPNFSDFYPSSLNNLGRVYPKDTGTGQNHFGSRTRFSNNYVADTAINGLNDYNDLDREDYNDANGDVMLTKIRENRLHIFKQLKDGWIALFQSIIETVTGQQFIGTSDKLLGPIQYHEFGDGIGNNPESWGETDEYMYHAAPNSGQFVEVTGAGVRPISKIFGYDYQARAILAQVKKYGLKIPFGSDKQNDNIWWSMPQYIAPVFNSPLNLSDWNIYGSLPAGSTPVIVTQPANGTVTYDSPSGNFLINMNADFVGTDTFTYKFALLAGGYSATVNGCITVAPPAATQIGYQPLTSSKFCTQIYNGSSWVNDGNETYSILQGYYLETGTLTGYVMPNIYLISPQAIIPNTSAITYNETTSPTPSGGTDGDVWYNQPTDTLYQRQGGVWVVLTNRVINTFYSSPTQNFTDCPVTPPANNFTAYAQYGGTITSIVNGTATGVPAGFASVSVSPPGLLSLAYSAIVITGGGTIQVVVTGAPTPFGRVQLYLQVNGIVVSTALFTGPGTYILTFPAPVSNPTPIVVGFQTF